MPAKRRTGKQRDHSISQTALAAWKAGDKMALHRALKLRPWQPSPLQAEGDCPWPPGTAAAASWELACQLRASLEEAAANA